ncbi:protein-disulfide reductase DsbD family protein [Alienimonas californiensis]|uniref:Thiol:disulfide interchange protein DsbD n=1 Tax=Alienimonas californiensis TaxID=2527989 RepID=A0A517PAP6_9PLAN|nr:cytochrome c biogenesis protein CcdA [Alienimonas californiensis]QDT16448.1 Thiol:disulfide interchange protein DsbD precursor [Alienimonas californiensis]
MPARSPVAVAPRLLSALALVLGGLALSAPPALGQSLSEVFDLPTAKQERLAISAGFVDADGAPLAEAPAAGETVTLAVTARIPEGFYLLSQTSPAGMPAKFRLSETVGLEPAGDGFTPDHEPKSALDPAYGGLVEKFTAEVTWTRPFKITGDAEGGTLRVAGELRGSYCSAGVGGACILLGKGDAAFSAELAAAETGDGQMATGEDQPAEPAAELAGEKTDAADVTANDTRVPEETFAFAVNPQVRGKDGPVSLNAFLPAGAEVGETVELTVILTIDEEYHVYALREPGTAALPTTLEVAAVGLEPRGNVTASQPAEAVSHSGVVLREHHGTVTFTQPFGVTAENYGLLASVRYQACTDQTCLQPATATLPLGAAPGDDAEAVTLTPPPLTPADRAALAALTGEPATGDAVAGGPATGDAAAEPLADSFVLEKSWIEETGLWAALPIAFLGGLILNFMPCVLPVIALKAMSFAKQAGQSRSRVLALNLWYSAGVLSVFLVFAALTLGLGAFMNIESFGWGDQVNSNPGKVIALTLVFALGLSMLGLYEIPVPGLVGSAAGATGHQEGALGAVLGGMFTTLLATPCTGPFIGAAGGFAVALAESNPLGSVAMWLAMGLGFASPYLLIAAIPSATRLLPRPGDWMVRFKEFGGLLLLGTALYLLRGVRPLELWMPILVGLLGLTMGLWIVGRMIRHNDSFNRKYGMRIVAAGVTAAVVALAVWIAPEGGLNATVVAEQEEGWEEFDVERLNELRASGRTVLVDFRSTICPNCDINEATAIDTVAAHEAYRELDIVPMKGWIDLSDEAYEWMNRLGGIGVPHLAVFPGDRPNDPAVYNGVITQGAFLRMLEEAAGKELPTETVRTAAAGTR